MFDELDYYLGSITTPENRQVLMDACRLLEKAGILSHEADVEQILRTADQHENFSNLQDIFALLSEYMESTINQFGLQLTENIPVSALNQILDSLLILPDFGDPEAVLRVIEEEISVEEKVCDIFAIVNVLSWSDFAPYIMQVSPSLMARVVEVTDANLLPEEASEDVSKYRERFNAWRDMYPDTLALTIIREGFRLKTPLTTLVGRFNENLEVLEGQPNALAETIIGLMVVSDLETSEFINMGGELLEDYAKDINVTTKAHAHFTQCLKELKDAQG